MSKSRVVFSGILVVLVSSFLFGKVLLAYEKQEQLEQEHLELSAAQDKQSSKPKKTNKIDSLKKLSAIMEIIETQYVDELAFDELVNKSIDGLLSNLDAHSAYLDEKKFKDLKVSTEGEFGGIGVTVGLRDGALSIIAPIDDTPGEKAGLKSGDMIIKINEKSTIDMSIDDAVNLMRGAPKTKLELTIVRKGENKPLVFNIVRDVIKIESVKVRKIADSEFVYVRVSSFDKNVVKSVNDGLKKAGKFSGIVLDLRNNPGGILEQAVDLGRLFIKSGIIVSQKSRNNNENIQYNAKSAAYGDVPMVVLINGGSASASEIVAGALQDHNRAVIVGEQSFGKGSVQTVMPFSDKEALKLTTAKYYLPSGRTIQAVGIKPDVIVYPGVAPENENNFSIKEADLKRHLQNELDKVNEEKQVAMEVDLQGSKTFITKSMIYQDIQLKSAIDILSALKVFGNINQIKK